MKKLFLCLLSFFAIEIKLLSAAKSVSIRPKSPEISVSDILKGLQSLQEELTQLQKNTRLLLGASETPPAITSVPMMPSTAARISEKAVETMHNPGQVSEKSISNTAIMPTQQAMPPLNVTNTMIMPNQPIMPASGIPNTTVTNTLPSEVMPGNPAMSNQNIPAASGGTNTGIMPGIPLMPGIQNPVMPAQNLLNGVRPQSGIDEEEDQPTLHTVDERAGKPSFFLGEGNNDKVDLQALTDSISSMYYTLAEHTLINPEFINAPAFDAKHKKNSEIGTYTRSVSNVQGYPLGTITLTAGKKRSLQVLEDNIPSNTPLSAIIKKGISHKPYARIKNPNHNKNLSHSKLEIDLYEYTAPK